MELKQQTKELIIKKAEQACEKAYAPYSNFFVGAALITESDQIYLGCNVENVSYGLTVCAERNAIFNAVTNEGSNMKIKAIAVANSSASCSPCGACRQVIAEFCYDNSIIIYKDQNEYIENNILDLLPKNFKF